MPDRVARADAALHHGGGLADALTAKDRGASAAFPEIPAEWRNEALAAKWEKVRAVRRVVTGALEVERRGRRIGSSLEAAPESISPTDFSRRSAGIDLAEIAITTAAQ